MKVFAARCLSLFGAAVLLLLAPGFALGQTHIWIDVPGGKAYSETLASPPTVTVENFDMVEDTVLADLTGSSFHSPSETSTTDAADFNSESVQVTVRIPSAGDWYLFAHYLVPTVGLNSFFVVDSQDMYIGASSGPSPDPVPFVDADTPPNGAWAWTGAPLGTLPAGDYTFAIYKREVTYGTSGESAKPEDNPHMELLYLTNGGAKDLPSDALFNKTQPFTAERLLSPSGFTRFGGPVTVSIELSTGTAAVGTPVTVVETLPSGFTPRNIGAKGMGINNCYSHCGALFLFGLIV
jgi:hypothetical protein